MQNTLIPPSKKGFTLIELMVTVAIVVVLTSIGIYFYGKWIRQTKVSEAVSLLVDIRAKQETYRQQHGKYLSIAWHPASGGTGEPISWTPTPNEWKALGVNPGQDVYFKYQVVAGRPGSSADEVAQKRGLDTNQEWFYAQAQADLSADGDPFTICAIDSQHSHVSQLNVGQ